MQNRTKLAEPGRAVAWSALVSVVTGGSYLAFLAWDQTKDLDPVTGSQTGPYQPWQVLGLGVVLVGLTFEVARRYQSWPVAVLVPIIVTLCFAVDAASEDDSGLWVIGATMVAAGVTSGAWMVAAIGAQFRKE